MPVTDQAKAIAERLRAALAARAMVVTDAVSLDLVAAALGQSDQPEPAVAFERAIPVLRMFDVAKAREFYCDFMGFTVIMEHRYAPDLPLYMGMAPGGLELHLSEHHGDASPGSTVFVWMVGVRDFHAELIAKNYRYGRPGLDRQPWGDQLEVYDPFGNRIRFCQRND